MCDMTFIYHVFYLTRRVNSAAFTRWRALPDVNRTALIFSGFILLPHISTPARLSSWSSPFARYPAHMFRAAL